MHQLFEQTINANMKIFVFAALLALAAAAPSYKEYGTKITIVSQQDQRDAADGSGKWSSVGSDGTTREEVTAQKKIGYEQGNTNRGTSYHISPEGERITLTWVADENGFQPQGDHLPTPPPIPEEILKMLPLLPKLVEKEAYPAAPYKAY